MFSLRQNTCYLWTFSNSVIISTDSVSYCLKMIILITLVVTLTQTRMNDFMGLRSGYLQTKIICRCSSPYVCVAVTEQRCSNDLRVLACFNLI